MMNQSKKALSERLKASRENKNLKQNKIADMLDIHNSTLAKYESGDREPDTDTLIRLADLYEVSLEWLIAGKTSRETNTYQGGYKSGDFLSVGGILHQITKEEAEHLKESLNMFRLLTTKRNRQKKE
jgi:transcriptional regulator with XRE-family HTH domain